MLEFFRNKYFPFYLISFSILILLIVPVLIQDGMFMDGQQYAIVAKNLAQGKGTFWFPFLTETWYKAGSQYFMEHPPLVYGIQAVFFKTLGTSMYVERLYSFTTAIITAILIIKLWRVSVDDKSKDLAFLPVFLWIITPVVFWTYRNNLQENTLGIFTLLSIINIVLFAKVRKYKNLILAGIFIFLSSLCKGVPGLFPMVGFFAYYIAFGKHFNFKKAIISTLILTGVVVVIYFLLMLNDSANKSLQFYFFKRLLFRINDEPTVSNRFYILYRLFSELLPSIAFIVLSVIIFRIKKLKNNITSIDKRYFLFFVLIGLSASLPLIFTKVQRGFYLIPSFPYFATALVFLIKTQYNTALKNIVESKNKILQYFSILLFISVVVFSVSKIGGISRDKDILSDVNKIGNVVPKYSIITTSEEVYNNWYLQFYLYRKFEISLNHNKIPYKYLLLLKDNKHNYKGFKKIDCKLLNYNLFVK